MHPCARFIVRFAASALATFAVVAAAAAEDSVPVGAAGNSIVVAQTSASIEPGAPAAWQPPDGGFGDYLVALQGERYMGLVYRRMSRELVAGDVRALDALITSYLQYRRAPDGDAAASPPPDLMLVEADVRSGLREATTTGLAVPEPMIEPVLAQARAIAARIYDLPFGGVEAIAVPEPGGAESEAEAGEVRRAESSGLLYDAGDFVSQAHLQFVFGGAGAERVGRLVAELMRVARADGLVADEDSVAAFVDRLVEDGVVPEADRAAVRDTALRELAPRALPPDEDVGAIDHDGTVAVTAAPDGDDNRPVDREGGAEAAARTPPADAGANGAAAVIPPERPRAPMPQTTPRTAPQRAVQGRAAPQRTTSEAKTDMLFVLEAAFGATVPAGREHLDPTGHSLARDADFAGRLALGVLWLEALGDAHAGLGLVAIFGRTGLDRLDTGPASVELTGSSEHIGLLPYLSVEMPVSDAISVRLGGGVGIAWRDVTGQSGGVRVVEARGAALAAQVGAGVRHRIAACMDIGFDLYATYLGAVKGRSGAVSARFEGTWDLAALVGLRVALNGRPGEGACR